MDKVGKARKWGVLGRRKRNVTINNEESRAMHTTTVGGAAYSKRKKNRGGGTSGAEKDSIRSNAEKRGKTYRKSLETRYRVGGGKNTVDCWQ